MTFETLTALSNLDKLPAMVFPVGRKGVVRARNELARDALKLPARAPYEPKLGWYALWVDDDAFWPQGVVYRMLLTIASNPDIDILAGWFSGRSARSEPKAYRADGSYPRPGTGPASDCEDGSVVEVARIGFHFVMHRLSLLEAMGPDPFTTDGTTQQGEDLAFCERAKAKGFRIWVHTGCPVAHIDDDGRAYLPGEPAMRVDGATLIKAESTREYGGLPA